MTDKTPAKEKAAAGKIRAWLHSSKSICALMILGAFLIVIGAVGYVMKQVFGDDKNEQEDDEP